ncbi:hypothetical protein VTI28DRAFT_8548 [Corynascus sepedonium]
MPGTASVAQADQTPARVPKVDIPVPGLEEPPGPAQFPCSAMLLESHSSGPNQQSTVVRGVWAEGIPALMLCKSKASLQHDRDTRLIAVSLRTRRFPLEAKEYWNGKP